MEEKKSFWEAPTKDLIDLVKSIPIIILASVLAFGVLYGICSLL